MTGRSYEEQRIAELAYAEEYRRRLRRERALASAGLDTTTDDVLAARAAADTESAAIVEREREAARARRARSEEILSRGAGTISADEWTPVVIRRGGDDIPTTETENMGVDFEPILRHTTVTERATAVTEDVGIASAVATDTADATAIGDGASGVTETAGAVSPTYRVALDGDISTHRIEIGGMQFTTADGAITPITKRKYAYARTNAPKRVTTTETEARTVGASVTDASVTSGAGGSIGKPETVAQNTDETIRKGTPSSTSGVEIAPSHAATSKRRGVIYADYGAMPGGVTVPFADVADEKPEAADDVFMASPRDTLGLADKPVGRPHREPPDNLDTPPNYTPGATAYPTDGTRAPHIHRDIDGDIDYIGPFDAVEPEYEYDGGITRRGRTTDIPEPRFTEEGEYGRALADDRRRRATDGTSPEDDGVRISGIDTHIPYDGSAVVDPDGVLSAPVIDPTVTEEEEYRRILGSMGGRVPADVATGSGVRMDGQPIHIPYDGRVVDDPEVTGREPIIDPTMLEEDEMLAFARRYGGVTTEEPTGVGTGVDFVGGYDMPGEERGADITDTYAPYVAPPVHDGVEDPTALDREAVTDRASERREMERDMTEFIRSNRRAEQRRREREAGAKREPTGVEPVIGDGSLIFDKKKLTRRIKQYSAHDIDLIDARIVSRISELEARREATNMTFSEQDRAKRRDRRKLLHDIKVYTKRLTRAKKFEKCDNDRYYAIVMTDLARAKLPKGASAERLIALRERAIDLLERRDELNTRLRELYRGTTGRGGGIAAREAASRKGRIVEYKKQRRLDKKLRTMKVAYDYRKRLEELMDDVVQGMGEIKLYEFILRRERPRGRAKREAKDKLKDAIRTYKRNKREIERISKKAFRRAKDDKRRKRGELAGWIALLILASVIGVCVWQWNTIWEFIISNVPILGEIFGNAGGGETP